MVAVNLTGFFHITQRVIRQMVDQGARAHRQCHDQPRRPRRRSAEPAALGALTKGGLDAVTRSLAIEYAARGVRVNAVSLGVIRTQMHADPASYQSLAALHPLGRDRRDRRRRRRHRVSRTGDVRHRRDTPHRRRPSRRTLTPGGNSARPGRLIFAPPIAPSSSLAVRISGFATPHAGHGKTPPSMGAPSPPRLDRGPPPRAPQDGAFLYYRSRRQSYVHRRNSLGS